MAYLNNDFFIIFSIVLWLAIFIYWVVRSKNQGVLNEITGLVKLLFSGLVLFVPILFPLDFLVYKKFPVTDITGACFTIFGFIVCIVSREYLASNWSGKVKIQEKHNLIKDGPYKIIRHPIYTGVLVMMLGSGIIIGNILDFVWVLFCFFGLYRKSKQEEKLLINEFGQLYEQYKKETKMMIPYLL